MTTKIADMSIEELRDAVKHCPHHNLSLAYSHMAWAKEALERFHVLNDPQDQVMAKRHYDRSKRYYLLSQETVDSQERRELQRLEFEKAAGTFHCETRGATVNVSLRELVYSNRRLRRESAIR